MCVCACWKSKSHFKSNHIYFVELVFICISEKGMIFFFKVLVVILLGFNFKRFQLHGLNGGQLKTILSQQFQWLKSAVQKFSHWKVLHSALCHVQIATCICTILWQFTFFSLAALPLSTSTINSYGWTIIFFEVYSRAMYVGSSARGKLATVTYCSEINFLRWIAI